MFKKPVILGIILLFLLSSIIPIASSYESNTGDTIYVDDDGCTGCIRKIQDAIDLAEDGDTVFVHSGIYYENIIINKKIQLIGENRNSTIIDGLKKRDVIQLREDEISVNGFTIKKSGYYISAGIRIESNYCVIFNNIFDMDGIGILIKSKYNNIYQNMIQKCEYAGIKIDDCYNNIYDNQIVNNEQFGIYHRDSMGYDIIDNNLISNNDVGIRLNGDVNGSRYNVISNNVISNNEDIGIWFDYASRNKIFNNTIIETTNRNWGGGIYLEDYSNSNNISFNTILDNYEIGINLHKDCFNNTIYSNNILNNKVGIEIRECLCSISEENKFIKNNFIKNSNGLKIKDSHNNIIRYNNFTRNNNGIKIEIYYGKESQYNIIEYNSFFKNLKGLHFDSVSNNYIIKNNFLQNNESVYYKECNNFWLYNYWDRGRILPYLIIGVGTFFLDKFDIDWIPAKEPYDIGELIE
jgi:nitrous oxidase accessory protein